MESKKDPIYEMRLKENMSQAALQALVDEYGHIKKEQEYIELNKAAEVLAPYIFVLSTRGFSREILNEINEMEVSEWTKDNALELRKTKWINRAIEELKK